MNKVHIKFKKRAKDVKFDKRVLLIVLAAFFYGLYAMNINSHYNTVASVILLIVLIILPPDKDIYVYGVLIPFYSFVPQGSIIRLFYFFAISILKILFKKGFGFNRKYIVCFLLWFGLEVCMDLLYAPKVDFTILLLMIYFAIYMMTCRSVDWEMGKNIILILISAFSIAIIFTMLTSETSLTYYMQTTNVQARFGEDARNLGGAMDLPIFCALVISIILGRIISAPHTNLIQKVIYLILISVCLVFGALTVSRSFIIAIIVIIVWTYISLFKERKHRNRIIPITVFVILTIVILLWKNPEVIENIFNKYSQRSFFVSSRSQIYTDCFEYLFTHPLNFLFGTGAFGYHNFGIEHNLAFQMFAHNLILDAIMSWGIIGSIFFCGMIYYFYNALRKAYGRPQMICFLPLVVWGAIMMTGGTFNYVEPYFYLIILIKIVFSYKLLGGR